MAAGKYAEWLEPESLGLLTAWAREGLDYQQMADNMGISASTFRAWRGTYPAISAAVKHGRAHAIAAVENALHKRSVGYTVEIKKAFKLRRVEYDPQTQRKIREYEELAMATEEMHVPADTTAQIFYLTNRKPEEWKRNRVEMRDDGEDESTGVLLLPDATEREEPPEEKRGE